MNENNETKNRTKLLKRLGFIVFAVFCGAAILYTALTEFGPASKAERVPISSINLNYLLLALAAFAVAMTAEVVKYYCMIYDVTGGKKRLDLAYKVAIFGKYYDNITPFGSGGQPFQIYHLQKNGIAIGDAAALPIAGFTCNQIAFVLMALVLFIINGNVTWMVGFRIVAYVGLLFYLFVPLMMIAFALFPNGVMHIVRYVIGLAAKLKIIKNKEETVEKIHKTLFEYQDSLKRITKKKKVFACVMGMSFIYQLSIMTIPYFVLVAFGGDAHWFDVLTMVFFVYACVTVVPTPGNAGAAEGAFYLLFQSLSKAHLFWAMLVWRFFVFYLVIILGLATSFYININNKLIKRKTAPKPHNNKEN